MQGITYEEMRQFYDGQEQREQMNIVMIQRLLIQNKRLESENEELKRRVKAYESDNGVESLGILSSKQYEA